jgi:hypothetical protein
MMMYAGDKDSFKDNFTRPIRNSFKQKSLLRAKANAEAKLQESAASSKSETVHSVNNDTNVHTGTAEGGANAPTECSLSADTIEIASEGLEKLRALHTLVLAQHLSSLDSNIYI